MCNPSFSPSQFGILRAGDLGSKKICEDLLAISRPDNGRGKNTFSYDFLIENNVYGEATQLTCCHD